MCRSVTTALERVSADARPAVLRGGPVGRGGYGPADTGAGEEGGSAAGGVWKPGCVAPGWAGLADQKRVTEGLGLLVELGHLEEWQEPTRGRVKTMYVVNPKSMPVRH